MNDCGPVVPGLTDCTVSLEAVGPFDRWGPRQSGGIEARWLATAKPSF